MPFTPEDKVAADIRIHQQLLRAEARSLEPPPQQEREDGPGGVPDSRDIEVLAEIALEHLGEALAEDYALDEEWDDKMTVLYVDEIVDEMKRRTKEVVEARRKELGG